MAKIDLAYNLEINNIVDAIEANELWIEGVLKDKRAFECIDENCNAKITCKNMDTFADKRKVNPHFIMSSRENMHSPICKVYKEYEERRTKKRNIKNREISQDLGKKVCFHIERPKNHRIIEHRIIDNKENSLINSRIRKKKIKEKMKKRNVNYYWLNSLILYYINSYKNGTTIQDTVETDFGKGKKYTYSLDKLFKRIEKENEETDKDKNHYVYYGKGKVFSRKDGGYDLIFNEKFLDSEKKVKCVIKRTTIDDCKYGKINKVNILSSSKGKEKFIYVLSSKHIDKEYKIVFLNTKNLDCVAISEIDLDNIYDEEYEDESILTKED
ncbi:hypothetical protein NDGK_00887 [Clostridiales bacterium CHKCI001]|nr:hypothetical protein NDGK_00887 [Clostridiales bacterium CHKCI001]